MAQSIAAKGLAFALTQEGVAEDPLGSNSGKQVDQYLASVGLLAGNPWCLAFVYWCYQQAAKATKNKNPLLKTGSCSDLYKWAKQNQLVVQSPTIGSIFLLKGGITGHKHTGFVVSVEGSAIHTIEGNTNVQGSAEGLYVMRRVRTIRSCDYIKL